MNEDIELLRVKKLQKQKFFLIFFKLTDRSHPAVERNITELQIMFVSPAKKKRKEII